MAKVTPQEFAEAWAQGLANSEAKMRKGVERTTKDPMQRAIAAIPKMQANFNAAVNDGRVAAGFASVPFAEWKRLYITKGLPRVSQGATAAKPAMAQVAQALLAHIDNGLAQLDNMPTNSPGDMRTRMNFWFDHMSSAKGKL